jgi:hypothetical protein
MVESVCCIYYLNKKSVAVIASLFAVVTVVIIGVNIRLLSESQPSSIPDEELIAKANELPEVQAFLTKYPNATANVEQSSDILVQHTISKSTYEGHQIDRTNVTAAREDSYLYIWVFMGSKSLHIQQISLLCEGGAVIYDQNDTGYTREKHFQINEGVVSYLKQGREEECFT